MDVNQHYSLLLGLGEEWKVTDVVLDVSGRRVDVYVEYAKKSGICPECGELCGLHDRLAERTWRHLDTMQFETFVHARTPRALCPRHGARVIELPWATKGSRFTLLFEDFAIRVLKAAKSVKDAQGILRLSWYQVQSIMGAAVERGLARRTNDEVAFVGLDEKSFLRGKQADAFACVLTDLDGRRVLDVACGRSEKGAREVIGKALSPRQMREVCGVAMDMSAPFEKAVREMLPEADVVFDKFHIEKHLGEGVDNTRKQEHALLLKENDRRLAKTKYLWLTGWEHLSPEAQAKREGLLRESLQTGRAWGFKELFAYFWKSADKRFAKANFTFWHEEVLKSGIKPMIKVANTLKSHLYGLLAWFDSRIDNALTEGFNTTIQSLKTTARGYRNFNNFRTAILFFCGKLDLEPDFVRVGNPVRLA